VTQARTGYAKSTGGAHVAYTVSGDGPIDLVYTTGYTIAVESLDEEPHIARMLRRFASFARLIQFDARGVGPSDPIDPAHPPTIDDQAADILAVLDALGVERATLVGESASGGGMIQVAATSPDRVAHLVLVNSAARYVADVDYPDAHPRELVEQFLAENMDPDTEWSNDGADDVRLMVATRADDARFREWWTRASRRGASPAAARAIVGGSTLADVRSFLPQITAPTLVLHGAHNIFVPTALGRYLGDTIPGAMYVELDVRDNSMLGLDADAYVDEIEEFVTGRRSGGSDRVLTTLLFTDIVDSTKRAAELGDRAWRALLDRHDVAVRAELVRYGGREVNTTGDGFLGAFDAPTQAVRAGQAIVRAAAVDGLAVRVGVHTGECERRGNDLAGLTVHIAARVAARAATEEVLVSRTVRDLVTGSDLRFVDRGEHELKGVPERWQLYALEG
jgi:class 3 adenylate cyclase